MTSLSSECATHKTFVEEEKKEEEEEEEEQETNEPKDRHKLSFEIVSLRQKLLSNKRAQNHKDSNLVQCGLSYFRV